MDRLATVEYEPPPEFAVDVSELFEALGKDPETAEPRLAHQIDIDALEQLFRNSDSPARVTTVVWGHTLVFTSDEIHVFASAES